MAMHPMLLGKNRAQDMTIGQKLLQINWSLLFLLMAVAGVGIAMLYSAASGAFDPWASRQATRFALALMVLIATALVDIRWWYKLAYPIYGVSLFLVGAVEFAGEIGMGAQRWIDLGIIQLQPSEIMKVAMVLALARWFHGLSHEEVGRVWLLIAPAILIALPVALVMVQPDLGTGAKLMMVGGAIFFLAGVRLWVFGVILALGLAAIPVAWEVIHDYQRQRILTFLNPENDPLGSGYHILQSMIALGSGGVWGKGYLMGSQSHLNFLPEKQTDFIFTMLAEEFGLVGAVGLVALYAAIIFYGLAIGLRARNQFARLLALGLSVNLFLYVFINIAMVTGMIPVVGVPLPLVSYGGTAMLSIMFAYGLIMSCCVHRDTRMSRRGTADES